MKFTLHWGRFAVKFYLRRGNSNERGKMMRNFGDDVGKRIKALQKSYKMTVDEFSKKCGISSSSMYDAFRGELTLDSIKAIAEACHVTLDHLFGVSEERNHDELCLKFVLKHVRPQTCRKTIGEYKYTIPTVRVSEALKEALKEIRGQGDAVENTFTAVISDEIKEKIFKSEPGEIEKSALEYVLVPLKTLDSGSMIESLGIMPESDKDIV